MIFFRNTILLTVLLFFWACNENKPEEIIKYDSIQSIAIKDSAVIEKESVELVSQDTSLQFFVERTIKVIAEKDFEKLSTYISDKGLRFSPYEYVEKENILLTSKGLLYAINTDSLFIWGTYDGSGEEIKYEFEKYYQQFIYDKDFVSFNPNYKEFKSFGNTLNNIKSFYADNFVVEFYFPGTKEYDSMDWRALFLIFEKSDLEYKLIGIAHGQWTI